MTRPAGARMHLPLVCLIGLLTTATVPGQRGPARRAPAAASVLFDSVATAAGLDFHHTNGASAARHLPETMSGGGLFFDYDADGFVDIFLVDGGSLVDASVAATARHRLYRNRGDGTFEDVTSTAGIGHREYGVGACAADYDNDGWTDLYVTNVGPNTLYRNQDGRRFVDVTESAGVGSAVFAASCAFADVDLDGLVDLFVANYVDARLDNNVFCGDAAKSIRIYCHPLNFEPLPDVLYRNNGDGTFADISGAAGIAAGRGNGLGVVFGDYDNDRRPDIFVANDAVPDFLYHNDGGARFSDVGLLAGVSVASDGNARAGMGTDFGDYDGDGLLDLFVTNHEFEMHTLFRNLGDGLFADATLESGVGLETRPFVGFGTAFLDYDNDGDLDLVVANGHVLNNPGTFYPGSVEAQRNLLLRNDGGGRFVDVGRTSGPGFALEGISRALAAGDIDNDGDLDLLVTNNGSTPDLLRNQGTPDRGAVLIRLVGTASNRGGIGARVRATIGGEVQVREVRAGSSYLAQHDPRLHIGVGDATAIDRLEILWPAGGTDVVDRLPANQIVTIVEGKGVTERTPLASR